MIGRQVRAEFLKLKRKGFWLWAILLPFGIVAMQMVNYGFRKEYLLQQSEDDWAYYLANVSNFTPMALILGIVVITSYLSSIEDEHDSWKQVLSLPVSKTVVYLAKSIVLVLLLALSSLLLSIFTWAYGLVLDLGDTIPYSELIKKSSYPYVAAFPIFAIQLWLAVISKNQALPLTVGIVGVILANASDFLPDWAIWKWPSLQNEWNQPGINVMLGFGVGCLMYVISILDFVRRDVK